MTRTELLTNLINDYVDGRHYMTVDTFRDMFINGLPGKLALMAVSRDGERILPIFDNTYFPTTEWIDYNVIREALGTDWTPIIGAHVMHRFAGQLPQTMLMTDGIVDENVLTRIFGNHTRWHHNMMGLTAFNFGDFDINTLPGLAIYTIDVEGARRIRLASEINEGRAFGIHLDVNGHIRYLDSETGKTMFALLKIGTDTLDWNTWPIRR
jgi:hypothetical protein